MSTAPHDLGFRTSSLEREVVRTRRVVRAEARKSATTRRGLRRLITALVVINVAALAIVGADHIGAL